MRVEKIALSFVIFSNCSSLTAGFASYSAFANPNLKIATAKATATTAAINHNHQQHQQQLSSCSNRHHGHGKHFMSPTSDENDDLLEEDEFEDDEKYEPLKNGIDSVSWLPSLGSQEQSPITDVPDGAEILPLFPLGGIVYTPHTEHVLNIFEPRYRQMYNDILMNGSRRFVVSMSHPNEQGRFAETGVIFQLDDLKEVSEQTDDQIKYVCNHHVTGRVKIHRVINPKDWDTRETYLKIEGTIVEEEEEEDENENKDETIYEVLAAMADPTNKNEKALKKSFSSLVDKQHELEEDVRFTKESVKTLAVAPGGSETGLWATIRLWQSFIEQRLIATQNEMQMEFQEKLLEFLEKEKGLNKNELPSAISFEDLSPALQQEVQDLQKRMAIELKPLSTETTLTIQKILEAEDHDERAVLLRHFIDAETKRLEAKSTLKGMFAGAPSALTSEPIIDDAASETDEEEKAKLEELKQKMQSELKEGSSETAKSNFFDDSDAFQ